MLKYILLFIFILFLGVIYKKYELKYDFNGKMEEYNLIQKYFFSDTIDLPEISKKKKIIWIYIDNRKNSRNWLSFYSRSSNNLNRPYLLSCIESIINKCGNDFKIILIDSDSFKRILPNWNIDMDLISGVVKENVVNLGILKLLYNYGGIKLPCSTIAIKNLKDIYYKSLKKNDSFCVEQINRSLYKEFDNFVPGLNIIGCKKGSIIIQNLINFHEKLVKTNTNSSFKIKGKIHELLDNYCKKNRMNLINGKYFGIKDKKGKPIDIHSLMGTTFIDFLDEIVCLYIPNDDLIKINKYAWFSKLSQIKLRDCNNIICKHLLLGEC